MKNVLLCDLKPEIEPEQYKDIVSEYLEKYNVPTINNITSANVIFADIDGDTETKDKILSVLKIAVHNRYIIISIGIQTAKPDMILAIRTELKQYGYEELSGLYDSRVTYVLPYLEWKKGMDDE